MKKATYLILTATLGVVSLVSVALLWKQNIILTTILISLAALMLLLNKSKKELVTFLFCGFVGAIAESFAVSQGAWAYSKPDIINIPAWLFVLWGIASIFIVRVYLTLKD